MSIHSEPSLNGQTFSNQIEYAPIPTISEAIEAHPEIRSMAPACRLLPKRSPTQIRELCRSIAETGQVHPINVDSSGALLNGRHRLLACHMLGIRAETTTVSADSSIEYVLADRHQRSYGAATLAQIALNLQAMITQCGSLERDSEVSVHPKSRFKDDTAVHFQGQKPLLVFRGECVRDAAIRLSDSTVSAVRRLITIRRKDPKLAAGAVAGEIDLRTAERQLRGRAERLKGRAERPNALIPSDHQENKSIGEFKRYIFDKKRVVVIWKISESRYDAIWEAGNKRVVVSVKNYRTALLEGARLAAGII